MKIAYKILFSYFTVICLLVFTSCDSKVKTEILPILTTTEVTAIGQSTASCGGNISTNAGSDITARGVCWSKEENPTIADSKTSDGIGIGSFTSSITGLTANTTYFVRAFATNSSGTAYGDSRQFTTIATPATVSDIDGNIYHTITIGTQVWMVENLKTTKFNDGTSIPLETDNTKWYNLTTPGYCWYDNTPIFNGVYDTTYTYGALYNWYAVNTGKLAPVGWHVPTDAEWTILESYVKANPGKSVSPAKALAAAIYYWDVVTVKDAVGYDIATNNSSGFSALPGGYRGISGGYFFGVRLGGNWWSSTEDSNGNAWYRALFCDLSTVSRNSDEPKNGLSVRCLMDSK